MAKPSSNKYFPGDVTTDGLTFEQVSRMFTGSNPRATARAPKKSDDTPRREGAPRPSISTLHSFGNHQNRTLDRVKQQFQALFETH
jgi:hypothetical protein